MLLPLDWAYHPTITVLRCLVAEGETAVTLFLKDTTRARDPDQETFQAGFVAVWEDSRGQALRDDPVSRVVHR